MTPPLTQPHGPRAVDVDEAHARLTDTADSTGSTDSTGLTVVDVRTPGEYAAGHLPGALNIPLDRLDSALPALRRLPGGQLLVVCASGARSENACRLLAGHGIQAMTLTGGTQGWARRGHELHRPTSSPRATWSMERQVRFTAGSIVLVGLGLGLLHPAWQLLSAGIAGGLVFSALSNTCGMAALLAKLPHNRPRPADLEATLAALARRGQAPVT
ncbi:rhodanese-like domain-containing protein [Streptomyces muensis]|uniref:Rhodanese-like domain-containing protein n=1 Tax=Streptomyces muensis TaxID=1077944 RepID=A0A9X1PUN0_STRM4|nr:rhodanese-like domain-containing protein [Streptomyces muensis]MCF1593782.1 rhodanese-like domain-containing protein [Streptomyces muensis]